MTVPSRRPRVKDGTVSITIELPTGELATAAAGLRFGATEQFVIDIDADPFAPPAVRVNHLRFAGFPHVLVGHHLCVYLDPAREWHPALGMAGFLERLWQWLTDAAQNAFDPTEALYHPVGGVLHRTPGAPTVVLREALPQNPPLQRIWIHERSPVRLDARQSRADRGQAALVVNLNNALPFSAGNSLDQLLTLIDQPHLGSPFGPLRDRGWPRPDAILQSLAATASRNPDGSAVYFLLAAPLGGDTSPHVLCGRLAPSVADALRTRIQQSAIDEITLDHLPTPAPIEWCAMSDERPDISTRRDQRRPVTRLRGSHIHLWGCGGLGSWIAELVVRAGAASISVCDPGTVSGGLLVRQNFTEDDIGMVKSQALARRLRAISDGTEVTVVEKLDLDDVSEVLTGADLLIDATVNIAVSTQIDAMSTRLSDQRRCLLAQVATDVRTSTLGLMVVSALQDGHTFDSIEKAAKAAVTSDSTLEPYRAFWREPSRSDELIPVRGCSVPTFHGSAADLAALAATFTNLMGSQLQAATTGAHLVALPHSGFPGPGHRFIPMRETGQ